MWGELALALYGLVALVVMLRLGYWFSALPTCLYLSGFASVGFSQLSQQGRDVRDGSAHEPLHRVTTIDTMDVVNVRRTSDQIAEVRRM